LGRAQELVAARDRLAHHDVRLLTLIGPGGNGKTRLAVELAWGIQDACGADPLADDVAFVDLALVRESSLVAVAIAGVVGVREVRGQPLVLTLARHFGATRLLLVLDNCEHVLDAAPQLGDLLAACPGLKILATTREPLRLRWEHLLPVPPLAVPDPARLPESQALAEWPAVALFVERAQAVQPHFRLSDANARAVATLCARLDGLPLALELAAARTRVFPPEAILARLDQPRGHLEVLRGGEQDRLPRHRGLSEMIAWSYGLLDPIEQALFRQLAVFVGGLTPEAANSVLGMPVLDQLAALVNKSLLIVQHTPADGQAMRFTMLETIREYAVERLEEAGEEGMTKARHAGYYLALAERVDATLRGPDLRHDLAALAAEQGNLRAALAWWLEQGDEAAAEQSLRLAVAQSWPWYLCGEFTEGQAWLERAVAAGQAVNSTKKHASARALRALALSRAGMLAFSRRDLVVARRHLDQSLEAARALADERTTAEALHWKMLVLEATEGFGAGVALLEESLNIYRALQDPWAISWSLVNLARVAVEKDDHQRAVRLATEALALAEAVGDQWLIAYSVHVHWVLLRAGLQYDTSRLTEALDRPSAVTEASVPLDNDTSAWPGRNRVSLVSRLAQSLDLRRDLGSRAGVIMSLEDFAWVAYARGKPRLASRMLGAADPLRRAIGWTVQSLAVRDREYLIRLLHARLGLALYENDYAAGAAATADQAIGEALELETAGPVGTASAAEPWTALSPREREVAALPARGCSNQQLQTNWS
jgi:non-specific serine/threonine protein kinase